MRPTLFTHVLVAALYASYAILTEFGVLFHLMSLVFCFIIGAISEGDRSMRFVSEVSLVFAANALAWLFITLIASCYA